MNEIPGINLLPESIRGYALLFIAIFPYLTRAYHSLANGGGLVGVKNAILFGTNVPVEKPGQTNKTIPVILLICSLGVTAQAQTDAPATNSVKAELINLAQGVNEARSISVAAYPGFAPDIKVNGVSSKWGAGVAALYPINAYSFAGVRLDYLGDQFWMPSCTVGLKADLTILGKYNVTPFTIGGAIFPLSGSTQDGQVGAIVGGGFTSCLWKSEDGKRAFNVFYAVEKWTLFQGVIHRPGVAFSMKF